MERRHGMARRRRRIAFLGLVAAVVLALVAFDRLVISGPRSGRVAEISADEALGATFEQLDHETASSLGLSADTHGLVVTSVSSNGPAASAGLRAGDVVERVGTTRVDSIKDMSAALGGTPHDVSLTLNRHRHYVIVQLKAWSDDDRRRGTTRRSDDQEDPRRRG